MRYAKGPVSSTLRAGPLGLVVMITDAMVFTSSKVNRTPSTRHSVRLDP